MHLNKAPIFLYIQPYEYKREETSFKVYTTMENGWGGDVKTNIQK